MAVEISAEELALVKSAPDQAEMKAARVKKRCVEMLAKKLKATDGGDTQAEEGVSGIHLHSPVCLPVSIPPSARVVCDVNAAAGEQGRALALRFCLSPTGLIAGEGGALAAVEFGKMALEGEAGKQRAVPVDGAAPEVIPAQLMLRSVGYRSVEMAGLPWNDSWGVVPTDDKGRVQVSDPHLTLTSSSPHPEPHPHFAITSSSTGHGRECDVRDGLAAERSERCHLDEQGRCGAGRGDAA